MVCVPTDADVSAGTRCWLTGWGTLQSGGSQPEILQQVSVPVVSQGTCKKSYKNKIHDSMICAGYPEGGKDACQGDSGNPRGKSGIRIGIPTPLVRHHLHGSISFVITTNIITCSPETVHPARELPRNASIITTTLTLTA